MTLYAIGRQLVIISVFGILLLSASRCAEIDVRETNSVDGKYANLLQTIHCPTESASLGQFKDYGYLGGGKWCGQEAKAGFWVWVSPNWYIWEKQVIK
jgi:hypothetical protein